MDNYFYTVSLIDIFLIGIIFGGFGFCVWYVGTITVKVERNHRDTNAIGQSLRTLARDTETRLEAFSFRLKTMLAEKTGYGESGFNIEKLRKPRESDHEKTE